MGSSGPSVNQTAHQTVSGNSGNVSQNVVNYNYFNSKRCRHGKAKAAITSDGALEVRCPCGAIATANATTVKRRCIGVCDRCGIESPNTTEPGAYIDHWEICEGAYDAAPAPDSKKGPSKDKAGKKMARKGKAESETKNAVGKPKKAESKKKDDQGDAKVAEEKPKTVSFPVNAAELAKALGELNASTARSTHE